MRRTLAALTLAFLAPAAPALCWTDPLLQSVARDARKLLPSTLRKLMSEREPQILAELRREPGARRIPAVEASLADVTKTMKDGRVSEAIARMGSLGRAVADLADALLAADTSDYPAGLSREYYAFVEGTLPKMPVIVDHPPALRMDRKQLAGYWATVLEKSRSDAAVLRTEMVQGGKVVSRNDIDLRSPVFGVGSLAYSRAVTAVAATWLLVWRDAKGDPSSLPVPVLVAPKDRGPGQGR